MRREQVGTLRVARNGPGTTGQNSAAPPRRDGVIPIVFPDYRISTPIGRLPGLGHAGVLFFHGGKGTTKYYEYGRYDTQALGLVRKVAVPDVKIGPHGRPTAASLAATLKVISTKAGHGGRISGAYIEVPWQYEAMLEYVTKRMALNSDPNRTPYSLTSNNCITFAKETAEAAGADTPWMMDPRPNSYIDELRGSFPPLDYDPTTGTLTFPE